MPRPNATALADRLLAGNARYAARDRSIVVNRPLPSGAEPWSPTVAIVVCSDLGADPDEVFDLPRGTLFVMQTAANVVGDGVVASTIMACREHQVGLVLVVGHDPCGVIHACETATDEDGGMIARELRESQRQGNRTCSVAHVEASSLASDHAMRMADVLRSRMPDDCQVSVLAAKLDETSGIVELLSRVKAGHR